MAVVFANLHILCMLMGTAATVQVDTIKQVVEAPMNRLEGKNKSCVDQFGRQIPLDVPSCDSYFVISGRRAVIEPSTVISKKKLIQGLPDSLKAPMEQRIKDFDEKFKKECSNAPFYCQFLLRDVVFPATSISSLLGVCAPCKPNEVKTINRLLQTPNEQFFLPMEGSIDFNVMLQSEGKQWVIDHNADELLLSTTGNSSKWLQSPTFAVRLSLTGKEKGGNLSMTLSYSTFVAERKKRQIKKPKVFVRRDPHQVTTVFHFDKMIPFPMVWVPQWASATSFFKSQQGYLGLSELAGSFFTYCNYTSIAKLSNDGWTSLCGRIYFINGSSNAELEKIAAVLVVNKFQPELSVDRCTMQMIRVVHSEGARKNESIFWGQHVTTILCMCNASMSDRRCDKRFNENPLDPRTIASITQTTCLHKEQHQINATASTGYYSYCVYSETRLWGVTTVFRGEPCYTMNDEPVRARIWKGACYACCHASPEYPCNMKFRKGTPFLGVFNECQYKLRYGKPNLHSLEVFEFPKTLPYAQHVLLPRADLIDVNKEFDKLMGFFHMDLRNFLITSVATFNPIGHAYFERVSDFSYKISSNATHRNRKMRTLCSISTWRKMELTMGCRCFVVNETDLQCCCLKRALADAARLMSLQFRKKIQGDPIDELNYSWAYRESVAVNKDVFEEE
ncbi:unnamed protein product [Bursaphelenchus xylophilus]|uniref:(pine wood nematode) hypothetical protein n=1 Tax=Bursaphelenchus xylophilus TaxID=6326 RepID=A0A1I7RQN2_BURXY|nr:unnamed protein product [Bursaphelenchus xylophilus]CAG9104853.1 unnamed protein product [Bursaphelenchus xylophilus]